MAKPPRSPRSQGRSHHRWRPRHRQRQPTRTRPRGVKVAIGDVDGSAPRQAAAEVGDGAIASPSTSPTARLHRLLDEVEQRLGPIDVIVNNAGIMPLGPFEEETERPHPPARAQPPRRHPRHQGGHGPDEAARHRPHRQHRLGRRQGRRSRRATYAATKHGVVGYSESVRCELRGTGVEVPFVMPVIVDTSCLGHERAQGVKRETPEDVADAIVDALKPALRRLRPEVTRRPRPARGAEPAPCPTARRKMGDPSARGRQERPRGLRGARGQERPGRRWGRGRGERRRASRRRRRRA